MKVRVLSEDHKGDETFDWPAIPREGDIVSFNHRGGTSNQKVTSVRWLLDTDGVFEEVEVHLTY